VRRLALAALLGLAALAHAQDHPHYVKRMAAFAEENARLDPAKRHVVLVGDSLTEGWERGDRTARFLPALASRVLNRGIGADTTRGLLRRLDASIFALNPSHVVLLMGVNDLASEADVVPAAERLAEIVRAVRARLPDVPLVLVTLAPLRDRFAARNPLVVALNAHVRRLAEESRCPLIDLHALLVDAEGLLPASHSSDGIHWTDAVYELLGREVERVVAG
jgi:lysophospholipase L1-like esterase